MSDATTVLFGLPGARVERVERRSDGTRVVDVITDEPTAAACPSCGVVSISVKEYAVTSPKDLPYGEDRIMVRWTKFAGDAEKTTASWGRSPRPSPRYLPASAARCGCVGRWPRRSGMRPARWAEVAQADAVSWPTAHRAFVAYAETGIDRAVAHPGAGR